MGAPSKRARKVREAGEFDMTRLREQIGLPRDGSGRVHAWTLAEIFNARDAQMLGQFFLPARLAESMRTDDALAVAYENRLAPQRCIDVELVPASGARAKSVAAEAEALFGADGVGVHPDTLADIHGCLVNHGIAFAAITATPRADGARVDFELRPWPIEYVRWDHYLRVFRARVDPTTITPAEASAAEAMPAWPGGVTGAAGFAFGAMGGTEVPIVHGDGRWVVFAKHAWEPWKQEAALLPAALVWARHAFACRDWAKGSVAHGNAKVIGEMPEGMALQDGGDLTAEAAAFLELLRAIASADTPIGLRPAGAKTDFLTNNSTAWQVWERLVLNAEKAAARIYLGTDGTLGATGGAPGVDISELFGVATTRVEGDLRAIERGLLTGLIEPWCAVNFGDSTLAPCRRYKIPDADEAARVTALTARRAAFYADVASAKAAGFDVTQDFVDDVARVYEVDAPMLPPPTETGAPSIALAPTDIARVVTVDEARASAGLPALLNPDGTPNPDGRLTVEAFAAKVAAAGAASTGAPPHAPNGAAPALRRSNGHAIGD